MYKHILVAIENSDADRAVLSHVEPLARLTGARLLLVHVADGWAARHFDELKLRESEEIREDREYLARICEELVQRGFQARARLAMGDPATELTKVATEESVDLIAMVAWPSESESTPKLAAAPAPPARPPRPEPPMARVVNVSIVPVELRA